MSAVVMVIYSWNDARHNFVVHYSYLISLYNVTTFSLYDYESMASKKIQAILFCDEVSTIFGVGQELKTVRFLSSLEFLA